MTDLEKHVSQPGRDKLVKQVRAKINELGVEYIFFQFISVTGRVVGKGIIKIFFLINFSFIDHSSRYPWLIKIYFNRLNIRYYRHLSG